MQKRKKLNPKSINQLSFIEHLEELRRRILTIIAIVFIFSVLIFFLFNTLNIYDFFVQPLHRIGQKLYFSNLLDPLFIRTKISFILAIVFSFPFIVFHAVRFVFPALKQQEKKSIVALLFFIVFLFFSGAYFAYAIMLPIMIKFLIRFAPSFISPILQLNEYIDLYVGMILGSGLSFLFPIVILFLVKIKLVHYMFLFKHIPEALIVVLIIAAVITPSTEVGPQVILTIPLFLLYLISIGLAYFYREK